MSNEKNEITENINSPLHIRIQSINNNNISQISEKSKKIQIQKNKYQYNFSNNNKFKTNNYNIDNRNNIAKRNIKCIKSKNISISPHKKTYVSPSKMNCQTNYSINKINNTYYVNGLNKSKINTERSPDLRFIPYENKEIYEKKKFINSIEHCNNFQRRNELIRNINQKNINNTNLKYSQYLSKQETNRQNNFKYTNLDMNTFLIENNNTIVKSSKRENHSFRSISNCSKSNKSRSKSNPKQYSSERKYKCDIKIHNINNNTSRENIRTFSSDNNIKKRRTKKSNMLISEQSRTYRDLEYEFNRNKSFDGKYLKMQNSQNLQILQEERLYQILIPIPPNETDHACHFQIPASNTHNLKRESKTIIEENEITSKKIFKKNIKNGKKKNWIKANSPKRENNKNENYENISKNSEENSRKFIGEMQIEKVDLNFERTPRNWNDNIQPKSDKHFSIERKPKKEKEKIFSETSVEKISIGALPNPIPPPEQKKSPIILSQQNKEKFSIKGIPKNFSNIEIKKDENNFSIKSSVEKNREEIEEREEKNIINDEEIGKEIKRNIKVTTQIIKNGVENSESSSEYDVLKQINPLNSNRYENIIKNSFEQNPNQRRVIINDISNHYFHSLIRKEINNQNLEIRNYNNNINLELPEPEITINPLYEENQSNKETEFNYRQSITNKEIPEINNRDINRSQNLNEQSETNNEQVLEEESDILDSPTDTKIDHERKESNNDNEENQSQRQTDVQSPKSLMREEFREEIISLSPKYKDKKEINYMEEEYKNYKENMRQMGNFMENNEEEEQDESSQKEQESNKSFSFKNSYNLNVKKKYQYICKTVSNKSNRQNKNENKKNVKQVIDNNDVIQNNEIIEQNYNINNNNKLIFKNKRITGDLNRITNDININNNSNNLEEDKLNIINLEEENNQLNIQRNNNVDENNHNSNIIFNSQKIEKNNDNSNLNEITFQRSNGLSKSQLIKKENKNNIQNKRLGNNNEINLGNICFNNTLKRPIKNEKKKEIINNETNLIHQYGIKKDGNNNNENKFKQNQNGRVRPLKI